MRPREGRFFFFSFALFISGPSFYLRSRSFSPGLFTSAFLGCVFSASMCENTAFRIHSERERPELPAARRITSSSSSESAIEIVFLRRFAGSSRGLPVGFAYSVASSCSSFVFAPVLKGRRQAS